MDNVAYAGDLLKCNYGLNPQIAFDFHMFNLVVMIPMAYFLLYNPYLRKFYLPLAKLVNLSIILNVLSCALFFYYYPKVLVSIDSNHCVEIILSRINMLVIMFAELHQIYVIAFALGVGTMRLSFSTISNDWNLSLEELLKYVFGFASLSILISIFYMKDILFAIEDMWSVFVTAAQLYVIYHAKNRIVSSETIGMIIPTYNLSITLVEKLSIIQMIFSGFNMLYRIASICFPRFINLESVIENLNVVTIFLFYLKVLLLAENITNVELREG